MEPDGKLSTEDSAEIIFTFTPDPGFRIGEVRLDGTDITSELKENTYTLKTGSLSEESSPHKLSVSFRETTKAELLEQFRALPSLDAASEYGEKEQRVYLDAWIQYQALAKRDHIRLEDHILQAYYKNLTCLPCFSLSVDIAEAADSFVSISDTSILFSTLKQDEAQKLLDGTIRKIAFTLKADTAKLEKAEENALLSLLDPVVSVGGIRISAEKTVYKKGASNTYPLTNLPLSLTFSLSGAGTPEKGYERSFYAARLTEGPGGKIKAELLDKKEESQTQLTISASSFPAVYVLLYQDRKTGEGQTEKPSSEASASENKPSQEASSDSGSSGNDSGNHDSDDNDSSTYVPDYEKEFWEEVRGLIQKAKAGETVNVNAVTYDRMPESVMDALRKNPNVALIVRWDGGDAVIIPALTALAKEEGRVYYPLSYLSGLYKTINAALTQPVPQPNAAPQITAPAQSASTYTPTPENMGVKKPQNSQGSGNGDSQEETDPQEETSTEETAAEPEGSLPASQDDHAEDSELLDTVQVTQAQKNPTTIIVLVASAALLILVLILIAVLLTLKNK
ncbi:MAG TPA: hypothetical protein H9761_10645 [Candidatus Eisenbergiella merdavium]|uniref:Uncharacterized protein n=1 Tax=Candidatus Eisenbergiella merdavium TaxID=2838551 RepID=A0A9D2SRG4_9FIRM|nr:hypothetical protein [Candidatus Eisenbergiella merdavium]